MFNLINNLAKGIVGVEASGQVTASDRNTVLEPSIRSALAGGDPIRLLYVTAPDFGGYENGEMLDDAVFGTRHFTDFGKIAFVVDEGPYGRAVEALDGLMPVTLKTFPYRNIEAAKAWLAE